MKSCILRNKPIYFNNNNIKNINQKYNVTLWSRGLNFILCFQPNFQYIFLFSLSYKAITYFIL